jgi:hypothetical protein
VKNSFEFPASGAALNIDPCQRSGLFLALFCLLFLSFLVGCSLGSPPLEFGESPPAPETSPGVTIPALAYSPVPSPSPLPEPTATLEERSPPEALPSPEPLIPLESPPSSTPQETPQPQPENTFIFSRLDFGPWDHVLALDWSPDGNLIAASAGEKIHLVSFPSLEVVHELQVGASTESLAFVPAAGQGSGIPLIALAVKDGSIQLWNASVGELLCSFQGHRNGAKSLAFTPDGLGLATTGMDAMVRIWDLAAFYEEEACPLPLKAEMIGGARAVPGVAIHREGSFLASIDLRQIRLREIASQRIIGTISAMEPVYVITFSPEGGWLVGGMVGDAVRIWEVGSLAALYELKPVEPPRPRAFTWSLAFHPSGEWLAAGSSTGTIRLWQIEGDGAGWQLQVLDSHSRAASSLAFHPSENFLASGGLDGYLLFWSFIP